MSKPKPECQKIAASLVEIAERTLPESLRGEVERHLAACPDCGRLVREFTSVWEGLSSPRSGKPSVSVWPALERALDEREKAPSRRVGFFPGLAGWLRPAAAILMIMAGLYLGFHLGGGPDPQGWDPQEMYVGLYLEDFTEVPSDSLAALYLGPERPEKE
jgi:ferric-dicitrate binding protein FerR (iron transport regulator)